MMKTMRKSLWICMILLVLVEGGVMGAVKEEPVSGTGWVLSEKEVKDLERKAEGGDIEAIWCLFNYYTVGFENSKKALFWARKGARLGDAKLRYNLGLDLVNSDDPKEKAEGVAALKESANQNYTLAQKTLAHRYEQGRGVRKNLLQAEKWFRKAAIQGNRIAMVEVVRLMAARARDIATLSEAYGWTLLALKRTPSWVRQPFIDKVRLAQWDILTKAKGFGADEKQFISRSEEWARKQDVNIPMTDPEDVNESFCKYLNKER